MDIISHPNQFEKKNITPLVLSIGNFDGLHLGHLAVIQRLKELASTNGHCLALTFNNHPSEVLKDIPSKRLISLDHKLLLLAKAGIDTTLLLDFSKELSFFSAEDFIQFLRRDIPFTHLVLGYDARFGNNRSGTPDEIERLSKKYGFYCEYVEAVQYKNAPISSSLVRHHIFKGELEVVQNLLGRPFSVQGRVIQGDGRGKQLGWPTANITVDALCIPPLGVYEVKATIENISYRGIANIGFAPTLKKMDHPLLEVHLLNFSKQIYDQQLEVQFIKFIRAEVKFNSLEELKKQIFSDIDSLA